MVDILHHGFILGSYVHGFHRDILSEVILIYNILRRIFRYSYGGLSILVS